MVAALAPQSRPSMLDAFNPAAPGSGSERLNGRESEVVVLVPHGLSNKRIAQQLDISVNTVIKHVTAEHAVRLQARGLGQRQ